MKHKEVTLEAIAKLFDIRFAEQDKKIESRLLEQDKKIEDTLLGQNKKIAIMGLSLKEYIDQRFNEQNISLRNYIDKRFNEQKEDFERYVGSIYEEFQARLSVATELIPKLSEDVASLKEGSFKWGYT